MKRIHNNSSVRRTTVGMLNRSLRTVLFALAMFLAAASGWAKNYTITWTNVPAGSTGSIIYNGVATSSSATTLASVGGDFISASEITASEIYVAATDVTYRGKVTVDEVTATITVTYADVPQNEFTVAVQTATTTNLANIIYDGTNYVHGSVITFPVGTTRSSLAAILDAQSASCTVNIAGSQQTFDHIVFAPKDAPYTGTVDINDRYPAGLKVGDGNLAATYYPHYYLRMTVERQTLKIQYIGDRSNVPLRYEIYYDGERQLSRLTTGQVGEHFPQVDKDYPLEANAYGYYDHYAASAQGPFSTLPYGVKVTNLPTTTVMDATTLQLQTAYTYQTIPFYPEGTRFSTIQQWFAANIGAATIDRTQNPAPDPTTADWANKHKGAYYFYNHNGELRIDSKTQVPTETEYQVIEGLEPGYGWAMIGNPYRFRIVNKLAGSGKYLRWVENANRGRVAGEVDGYFTFDDEGSEFSVLWNYSVKPGDYGWAGYLQNYDYNAIRYAFGEEVAAQALGLNGYPPYAFGCTIALCPETSDGTEEKVLALTLDQDGDGNIVGVTMKELWLYTAMMTNPDGTPYIDPVTHQPVFFDGRGPADIATMRPDAHVYMGTLDTRFADMNYTVKVSVPSGATLADGGVIYDEDFYADARQLTFASQPATTDFTSRAIDGYEGIVSIDHQNRFIQVTYLRHGATDNKDDYFYLRNTAKWAGYFIDDLAEGGWTVDPNHACLVHPIPAGSVSGINNGHTYAGVPAFYLYEQASGSYWIDDDITTSQTDATRYIFIDASGNVSNNPQPGVTYAMVSEHNLRDGDNISETWDPAPYSSSPTILSNLPEKSGEHYGCEWEFVPYVAPKAVKVNILYSDATGNRITLPESAVQWGLATVPNGGTLYTIDDDDIPGLILPVINPRDDTPLLYIYNLNIDNGTLTVIYQDTHSFKTRQDLLQAVQQNRSFAIYNRNGGGFLVIETEGGEAKAQIRGAWEVEGTGLATAEYSHPVQIFNGNAVWNVEVETTPSMQYYLRNAATGYYLAEDRDGNYTFSLSRTPIQTFDSLDELGYFQTEVRPNVATRCGIDLTDPVHPMKTMLPSQLTQMQIVYPSENTTIYSISSNVEAGGITLLATNANYQPGDFFYYTIPITNATAARFLKAIAIDGYTADISITTDNVTHRGEIRVDYTPNVATPSQLFFVRGATGYDNHGYFVSSGNGSNGTPMCAPTDVVPNTQVFAFESAGIAGGTPLYNIKGVAQAWNPQSNDGYLNADGTAYVADAEQAGKFALVPVAGKTNTYYIAPSTNLSTALNWNPAGGYSEADDAFGLYPINDGQHDPFEIVPYTALTYHIVIKGADGGQGRVKFGAAELKDGDSFDVFVRLDSHDFNILPVAGTHYIWKMDDTTLTIEYLDHSMARVAEPALDENDTDRIAQDGSLYTLRTTASTQGHDVGDKGYYRADNTFVSDYDDITQNAIDYTDPFLLWQNVIYDNRIYSWSEAYQRPIGRSIALSELQSLLNQGTWFFENTGIKSVPPYYYFDVVDFPHKTNGAVGDPTRLRFKMPRTDLSDPSEITAENPGGYYTHDTYFDVDATGHAEGVFVDVPQNLKSLVIEYKDEHDQWQTLTPANCATLLGSDYPTVSLAGHSYTVTFHETLASLIARAESLADYTRGDYFYPVPDEQDQLLAAIAAAKADGAADTPAKRQALNAAIAHFIRPDVPVEWPEGSLDLVHIGNRQSNLYLYFKYGDVLSRLTDDRDRQPTSVWYFKKVAELPDGSTQVMLYNANGDPTPIIGYTAYQMGHPEWGGSLFNVHILSGGVFFDPMYDILQFDASGNPTAGTFYPHGTPEAKDRYSLLSNLLAGTPLDAAAQTILGVKAAYSIEEMADMESAYWFARVHNVPAEYHRYDVRFVNVPAGNEETLFIEAKPEAGLGSSDHTVTRATTDGFFILTDTEASADKFTATDFGYGSTYTIDFQKGTAGAPGTVTVTYNTTAYYKQKLQAAVTAAQATLTNDPLTFGYPSQAAREALQSVVTAVQNLLDGNTEDYFTALRFTDQMQVLNTAVSKYETTLDVITPQVGDVISLKGIIDNGSVLNVLHKDGRELEVVANEDRNDDKLLDEIAATHDGDPASYTNDYFWVVRPSDRPNYYYLESAYGDGLYLSSFGPSAVPTPWFFSAGTQKGRLSLYYYSVTGSRYAMTAVERDADGTIANRDFANLQGHTHVATDKQQTPDASTDFIVADSRNMVFSIRVLGYPTAKITISLGSYDGQSMVNDGGFYSIGAADVKNIMETIVNDQLGNGAYETIADAALLAYVQEGIASYVMGENIDGMEYTKECTITSYDRATGYVTGAVVTFNYVDNLEALKERMNNVLNTASLVSGVFDISDIADTRTAVNGATTREAVLSTMRQFLRKSSSKSVTFTNVGSTATLATATGTAVATLATATDADSQFKFIYVENDAVRPYFHIYNVAHGSYLTSVTEGARLVSTSRQDGAGVYVMEGVATNTVTLTSISGTGYTNLQDNASGAVYGAVPDRTNNYQRWGLAAATTTLPIPGSYYYLPGTTGTNAGGANCDNPAQMCYVTRQGNEFIIRPIDAKHDNTPYVTVRGPQTAYYTMKVADAAALTWTPVVLPEGTDQIYTGLLELYFMSTLPTLSNTYQLGAYYVNPDGNQASYADKQTAVATALKTNNGGNATFNTATAATAQGNLMTAIQSLTLWKPIEGFYRLRNVASGKYLTMKGARNDVVCPVGFITLSDDDKWKDAESIFFFEGGPALAETKPVENSNSRLLCYANGQYLYATNVVAYPEYQADAKEFTVHTHAGSVGCYAFYYEPVNQFLASGTDYTATVNASDTGGVNDMQALLNLTTGWELEEVTSLPVTIGTAGQATVYFPVPVKVPGALTSAHYASNVAAENNAATPEIGILTESADVRSRNIAARTALVLHGAPGTYEFQLIPSIVANPSAPSGFDINTVTNTFTPNTNFTGTIATTPKMMEEEKLTNQSIYVLMKGKVNGNEVIGFFRDYIGNLNGFKAYVTFPVSAGSNLRAFIIRPDGTQEGIDDILADPNADIDLYDLSGRRITREMLRSNTTTIDAHGRKTVN